MNKLDKKHQWISWETSTHYCISEWEGFGTKIKNKWVKR